MIKVFMGLPGNGKTKQLLELVNKAVENEPGKVVCIEPGQKLRYDLNHDAKLVDMSEYALEGGLNSLYAFLCGMYTGNYDITHVFIDGTLKIAGCDDIAEIEKFLASLEAMSQKTGMKFTLSLSTDIARATDAIKKFF